MVKTTADLEIQLAEAQRKQKIAHTVAGLSTVLIAVGIAAKYCQWKHR